MKIFLGFVALLLSIGAVQLGLTVIEGEDKAYEHRLVGALNMIEAAIQATSPEVERAELYSPSIERGAERGAWQLTAVAAILDVDGRKTHERLVASMRTTCGAYGKPECWQIDSVTIGEASLPIEEWGRAASEDLEGADAGQPQSAASPLPDVADTESGEDSDLEDLQQAARSGADEDASSPADSATATAAPTPPSQPGSQPPARSTREETPIGEEQLILLIQEALRERGYDSGPRDGRMGPQTMSAILAYQRSQGLPVDGEPTRDLLAHLRSQADAGEE